MFSESTAPQTTTATTDTDTVLKQFSATPDTSVQEETSVSSTETEVEDSATSADQPLAPSRRKFQFLPKTWHKVVFGLFLLVLILAGVGGAVGFYTYQVAMELKAQAQEIEPHARGAYDSFKAQNLPGAQAELKQIADKLVSVRQTYDKLGFYKSIPIANVYYADGIHGLNAADAGVRAGTKSLDAIVPYADVLGFTGEGTFTGGTAEDRLKLVLQTLEKVTPQIDDITNEMKTVQTELDAIDPNRYPEQVQGQPVRPYLTQAQTLADGAVTALTDYRPIIEQLPAMAGGGGKRQKYLILFQNDNELRPTGGFLTAYATIFVEDGKVTPEKSDDIYELDKKYPRKPAIPEALGRYLTTEKQWNLRDMNISPDFKKSMDQFYSQYQTIKSEPQDINGIIAIDTHVLVELMKILGPVEVPGYGTFSAENDPRCDCPQIIYELSNIITRPTPYIREDRKGILGPLMRGILTKVYTAPKQNLPQIFEAGFKALEGRHAQMYFFNEQFQAAADTINATGRLKVGQPGEDFLAIVNANLGGAKSNLFINYDVKQTVSAPENGVITKTVEITYKNNRRGDNCNLEAGLLCLNSTLRDWTRLYLPTGSKLVEAQGFTATPKEYEEDGFSVLDGFFILEPNSQAKLRITYTVPYTDAQTYKLKMWKQGGINPVPVIMDVNGGEEEFTLDKDTAFQTTF